MRGWENGYCSTCWKERTSEHNLKRSPLSHLMDLGTLGIEIRGGSSTVRTLSSSIAMILESVLQNLSLRSVVRSYPNPMTLMASSAVAPFFFPDSMSSRAHHPNRSEWNWKDVPLLGLWEWNLCRREREVHENWNWEEWERFEGGCLIMSTVKGDVVLLYFHAFSFCYYVMSFTQYLNLTRLVKLLTLF